MVNYRPEHEPTCPKDTLSLLNAAIGSRWKCRNGQLIEIIDIQYYSGKNDDPCIEVAVVGDPDETNSLWHEGYMNYLETSEWDVIDHGYDECPY